MPKKNGHDPPFHQMVEILAEIPENTARTNERLAVLERLVAGGFDELGSRIDNILPGELGQRVRGHKKRLTALEARVTRLAGARRS